MSELLTERLSVLGQGRLRHSFSSALIFATQGVANLSPKELSRHLSAIERFKENPSANFLFSKLRFQTENRKIWIQCLTGNVYALGTFEQELQSQMHPLFETPKTRVESFWQIYAGIYARELLLLGSQTICNPQYGFNQETVQYFIEHPEKTHGEELINSIPPLLEKGYIYLNNCGENQQTDWHRYTFMDSYFKALMSYRNVLSKLEIRTAFHLTLT